MKRVFFIVTVFFFSFIFVYSTIISPGQKIEDNKAELENFLVSWWKTFSYNKSEKKFIEWSNSEIQYQSINPIDWVYYSKWGNTKIQISSNQGNTKIQIWEWIYVFVLNDIFEKYEIIAKDFSINQLWKWIFYLDNNGKEIKIYSYNSLINIKLLSLNKEITNFNLFPSLVFKYNPSYNSNIIKSDILRVATVNDIYYIDSKSEKFLETLSNKDKNKENFLTIIKDDISKKYEIYSKLYRDILDLSFEEISWSKYIKTYDYFLKNELKKDVYLRNNIARSFVEILKNYDLQKTENNSLQLSDEIKWYLSKMQEISPQLYQDWYTIIKNYYYLSYFWNSIKDEKEISTKENSHVNKIVKWIFWEKILWDEYFSLLSDIFYSYSFLNLDKNWLNSLLDSYIKNIKNNTILKESDFLTFSFFLSKFSEKNTHISKWSINIVVYLIEIFNNYYEDIRLTKEEEEINKITIEAKKYSALSVYFMNMESIINNINKNILSIFFYKKDWISLLKEEYIKRLWDEIQPKLWEWVIESLNMLNTNWTNDIKKKKDDFYVIAKSQRDETNDRYKKIESRYLNLNNIYKVLTGYNKYINNMKLTKDSREAEALLSENKIELSEDIIKKYLERFDWIDLNSLVISNKNTLNKDLFYDIKINIGDRFFAFKLKPQWNTIFDIEISWNWKTQKLNFEKSLDELEKDMKDRESWEDDPILREKYNFDNFFTNLNLDGWNDYIVSTNSNQNNSEIIETREISIFKQDKLINWDFTNFNNFLIIPYKNIIVKLDRWIYNTTIDKVLKNFGWENSSYQTEITSKYDFIKHKFIWIILQVYLEDKELWYDFNWIFIKIIPQEIHVRSFSIMMKDLWKYLDVLKENYNNWNNVYFDLQNQKVLIDSESYNIN